MKVTFSEVRTQLAYLLNRARHKSRSGSPSPATGRRSHGLGIMPFGYFH
jgi:hypothetical protein